MTKSKKKTQTYAKTDVRYWRQRLTRRSNDEWHCRIGFGNRQDRWPLHTANRDTAATKARDIYLSLKSKGYEATRLAFKPWTAEVEKKDQPAVTVGEFLTAVRSVFTGRQTTLTHYERKFRFLVAQLLELKSDRTKFDPKRGFKKHRNKIDATPLEFVTPERITQWRVRHVQAAGNPLEQNSARVSAASVIANGKALFSKKVLAHLKLTLPSPLPFAGVDRGKLPRARYRSKVNIEELTKAAYSKLKDTQPEVFKIYLLALGAGLRRGEIDCLTWAQFDFQKRTLSIEVNQYGGTKTDSSAETIDLSTDVAAYFEAERERSKSEFVIESAVDPKAHSKHWNHYRCGGHFRALINWLRSQGVTDRTPIHSLRKEFGSLINQEFGIFAASAALRHSNIGITRTHYVDRRQPISLDVSKLLTAPVASTPVNGKPAAGAQTDNNAAIPVVVSVAA